MKREIIKCIGEKNEIGRESTTTGRDKESEKVVGENVECY